MQNYATAELCCEFFRNFRSAKARYPKKNPFTDGPQLAIPKDRDDKSEHDEEHQYGDFRAAGTHLQAFAHPARLQILDRLGQGELGVADLQEVLGISKTNMSQHVAVLKSVGVLSTAAGHRLIE